MEPITQPSSQGSVDNALEGMLVIDLSQGIAGPYCAATLRELGATVVKVEPPGGDWARRAGPRIGTSSIFFESFNRGKESLALDLKTEQGLTKAKSLITSADIVVENSRPGSMTRLGLGYSDMSADNRRLIQVSISGFGQSGPRARQPATDSVIQAFTGLTTVVGTREKPARIRMALVDIVAGLYASQAALAAIVRRLRSGVGQHLDISLVQAMAALQTSKIVEEYVNGPTKNTEALAVIGLYEVRDGIFAVSAAHADQEVAALTALGCADLLDEPEFATLQDRQRNQIGLRDKLARRLAPLMVAECLERLQSVEVPCQRILNYEEFMADPHIAAMKLFQFVQLNDGPLMPIVPLPGTSREQKILERAPLLDEHASRWGAESPPLSP